MVSCRAMDDADRSWLALLDEQPRRVLLLLADSPEPVSGRRVAQALNVSPTTATATLQRLRERGLVRSRKLGRAHLWELDEADPRVRQLHEDHRRPLAPGSPGQPAAREPQQPTATVVVLTALGLEYAAVREHLHDVRLERARHGTRFEVGWLPGEFLTWDVAIAEIGMGNAAAAAEVGPAIELFNPDLLLFVGVAGSVKPADLRRGDVVIADHVYNLHAGKAVGPDPLTGHLSRPLSFPAPYRLLQLVRAVCRSPWPDVLLEPGIRAGEQGPPHNDAGRRPQAQVRAIAAGEIVLASRETALRKMLGERFNDVAAIDMESFGLYETAHRHDGLPVLAVRGISDTIGDKTPDEDAQWQPRAAVHAAGFTVALLRQTSPEDLRPSRPPRAPDPGPGAGPRGPAVRRDRDRREVGGPAGATSSRRRAARARLRAALDRLPPPVEGMHAWARRHDRTAADRAVLDLARHTEAPASWLGRVRHRAPDWLRNSPGPASWALLATFAAAYESPYASWAYEQASDRAAPGAVRAVLLCRAGLAAAGEGRRDDAHRLLTEAKTVEPTASLVVAALRAAVDTDIPGLLRIAGTLAPALDVLLPIRHALRHAEGSTASTTAKGSATAADVAGSTRDREDAEEAMAAFRAELVEDAPELLGELQDTLAMAIGIALRASGDHVAALQVFRAVAANAHVGGALATHGTSGGPRAAGPLLQEALTLFETVTGPTRAEQGSEVSATLRRVAELALVARDRRRDWNGPTGDALALAGRARALAGDGAGVLRLLLPPPRGMATAAEAGHPEVLDVAARTALMSGDTDLALQLAERMIDQAEANLVRGLAYSVAPGSEDLAVEAFRRALAHADRPDQRFRALLGLSRLGHLDEGGLAVLAKQDPEAADVVRAAERIRAGRYDEALLLARRHPHSIDALHVGVDALLSAGRPADAVEVLETAARRRGEEELLTQAADIAIQAGMFDKAERLASVGIGSIDVHRQRISRRMLLDLAARRGDWQEVAEQASRLLDDISATPIDGDDGGEDDRRTAYRWMLVTALTNQRRHAEALRALEQPTPLAPRSAQEALLSLHLLRAALTDPEQPRTNDDDSSPMRVVRPDGTVNAMAALARAVTLASAFRDDETVSAAALALMLTTPAPPQLPDQILAQVRGLQEDFFTRFPKSRYLQRLSVGEDLSELRDHLRATFEPGAAVVTDLAHRVWLGVYPAGVLAEVTGHGYAENLIKQPTGCLVVAGADPQSEAAEQRAALDAIGSRVVVDTSTLVLLEQVIDDPQRLLAHFSAPLVSATLHDDALHARGNLLLRSTSTLGWDPKRQQPLIVEHDPDIAEVWAQAAMSLVDRLTACTILQDPLPSRSTDRLERQQWHASIALAAGQGVPLLADDAALRAVARAEDVPAFGTLQLLRALASNNHSTAVDVAIKADLPHIEQRMRAIRALDLGTPVTALPRLAADERFSPNGTAALLLAHPPAWQPVSAGFDAYATIVRALPTRSVDQIAGWCAAAVSGLAWATVPAARPRAIGALLAWTTLNAGGTPVLPAAMGAASSILTYLLPDTDMVVHVVDVLAEMLETVLSASDVPGALLPLLADLPEDAHARAVHHFLTRRSPGT
jgi:nucleoside phosphorylase/tetratricopeptide (TPR) repeat protein